MKHISLLSCLIFLTLAVSAQKPKFGLFAGPQETHSRYSINSVKQKQESRYGFFAGASAKIPFDVNLFFAPQLFYSSKGYKVSYTERAFPPDTNAVNNQTRIHTVELAFLLQFDFGKSANHLFMRLGPSLDFQLSGREKFQLEDNSVVDRKMVYGFAEYGHYAASMLLQAGFETKAGWIFTGHYTHGLGNLNNADDGPRILHRALGLSVGKYL